MNPKQTKWEQKLVQRCLRSEREAWNELYSQYNRVIKRTIGWHVKNFGLPNSADLMDEFVQETYRRLMESLKGFDAGKGSLKTYVTTIAYRCVIEHLRKKYSQKDTPHTEVLENQDSDDTCFEMLRSNPVSVENLLAKQELLHFVHGALAQMRETCRNLIKWRFLDEQSYGSIALRLQSKENAARERTVRCLDELKGWIDEAMRDRKSPA